VSKANRFRLAPVEGWLGCRKVLTQPFDGSVIDAIVAHYPDVPRTDWEQRFALGHVFDGSGGHLAPDAPFRAPLELHYYRPFSEAPLPVTEAILFQDEHLVVVDKPHFLPVHPAGKYLKETLVARVIAQLGNPELTPLHRLDRATAGLVLFSTRRSTRGAYQNLFRDRLVAKRYEALAPQLPHLSFPLERSSRLERHPDGFRSLEVEGEPNAMTRIEVVDACGPLWRYALFPSTGQMHQLRVHMNALGAPIANDRWYPQALPSGPDDFDQPLMLLAQELRFDDPVTGAPRAFRSRLALDASRESACPKSQQPQT
jgi:tRNA pseudouridine32 synthase / 23S rRNA pseudouridine746 synthase